MNKRGETTWKTLGIVFGSMALIILIIYIAGQFAGSGPSIVEQVKSSKTLGAVTGVSFLDYLSYFVGGVPDLLVQESGAGGAVVIILALFVMLLVTFGDIISTFGLFSSPSVAWVIGAALAIVAANLKGIMYLAVWAFRIIAGVGILSVAMGVLVPFVLFFLINWGILRGVKQYFWAKKADDQALVGLTNIRHGMRTLAGVGKETRAAGGVIETG
jgi:hypothetical protein